MGKFDRASTAMIRRKKAAEGKTITVTRKKASYSLTGWHGRGMRLNAPLSGARIEVSDREFFFVVADWTAAGLGTEPQKGDRFQVSGETLVFECLTPETGEAAWRYADNERSMFRIHTKNVK